MASAGTGTEAWRPHSARPGAPRPGSPSRLARPQWVTASATAAVVAYLVALSWAMQHASYDIWGGMVVLPVLLAVTIPLVTRSARREGDLRLARILALAVVLKVAFGTLLRYAVIFQVYGSGDAQGYHGAGRLIASSFRDGDFTVSLGGGGEGTQATNLVTGLVYTVIGPTKLGGFFVFSWLSFLGLLLLYKAYRTAMPSGDHCRYAMLLFFLPTLVFWPSSLGKEALMMLTLGVSVYGAARIFAGLRAGYLLLFTGLWATALIRPHLVLLVFAALIPAYLVKRGRNGPFGARIAGVAVLVVLGLLATARFQEYFKLDDLDTAAVGQLLEDTADKSQSGDGSDYGAVSAVKNPLTFPLAVLAVLFRPFPFEANNVQALATSLEGTFLIGMFVVCWRRVWAGLRQILRSAFVAFCVAYSVLFVVAFSSIGNFGILARQRSLVYPMVIALLTLPLARRPGTTAVPVHASRVPAPG